jgi:iron complex outermembrane recepter protein
MKRSYRDGLLCPNILFWSIFLTFFVSLEAQAESKKSLVNKINNQLEATPFQLNKASDLFAQAVTRVTGIKVDQTAEGLEIILETAGESKLIPLILPEGNNLVIDILDATLTLPSGNQFREINPAPGIKEIAITKIDDSNIRLTITGEKQAPSAEVIPSNQNLVLSVTPEGATTTQTPDEEIEIIATGEGQSTE